MPDTPGTRLRAYIDARWTRRQGGILALAGLLNVATETMYEWFRDDRQPNLDHLARLSRALGVKRWEIVAAMDGEATVAPIDEATRAMLRAEIEAVLDERLGPRKAARGPEREAG